MSPDNLAEHLIQYTSEVTTYLWAITEGHYIRSTNTYVAICMKKSSGQESDVVTSDVVTSEVYCQILAQRYEQVHDLL